VAKVEVNIPRELGLSRKQMDALEKSFKKQLVETLKDVRTATKAKSKLMVMSVRAKSKNQIV
jgi:hypothetical protein